MWISFELFSKYFYFDFENEFWTNQRLLNPGTNQIRLLWFKLRCQPDVLRSLLPNNSETLQIESGKVWQVQKCLKSRPKVLPWKFRLLLKKGLVTGSALVLLSLLPPSEVLRTWPIQLPKGGEQLSETPPYGSTLTRTSLVNELSATFVEFRSAGWWLDFRNGRTPQVPAPRRGCWSLRRPRNPAQEKGKYFWQFYLHTDYL